MLDPTIENIRSQSFSFSRFLANSQVPRSGPKFDLLTPSRPLRCPFRLPPLPPPDRSRLSPYRVASSPD